MPSRIKLRWSCCTRRTSPSGGRKTPKGSAEPSMLRLPRHAQTACGQRIEVHASDPDQAERSLTAAFIRP